MGGDNDVGALWFLHSPRVAITPDPPGDNPSKVNCRSHIFEPFCFEGSRRCFSVFLSNPNVAPRYCSSFWVLHVCAGLGDAEKRG